MRTTRSSSRRLLLAAFLVLLAAPLGGFEDALAEAPFTEVHATRVRLVCHLPQGGYPQRVLGYDAPKSFVYNGAAYWSVGDSVIDLNGDGYYLGSEDKFSTGSIGRTTDLKASDCVDVKLRTNDGQNSLPILTPKKAAGECLIWPQRPFEADGNLFFFYGAQWQTPGCPKDSPVTAYKIGLGTLGSPGSPELAPSRVGSDQEYHYVNSPLKEGGRVYLFREWGGALTMARVAEAQVATRSAYEYWDGNGWVGPDLKDSAQPIVQLDGSQANLAFFAHANRYMIVYSCGGLTQICARTARETGTGEAALTGGFNEPTVLTEACVFCTHVGWQSGYRDPAHPGRIYVSWARVPNRFYFGTLLEIDLSPTPPPSAQEFIYPARDWFSGAHGWTYVSYDKTKPGADLVALQEWGSGPPDPEGATFDAWVGPETVDGNKAPGVFASGGWPSATRGAARVWTAPSTGYVALFGEAWLESTLGDNAIAEVFIVSGTALRPIWMKKLAAKWKKNRNRVLKKERLPVLAGDKIVFGVRAGTSSRSTASYDLMNFLIAMSFTPA